VDGYNPVHRFLNTVAGGHLFTTDAAERDSIVARLPGLTYEGIAYYVPKSAVDSIFDL
jgi:hypothetical protein